jgi:hypothetical protein
VSDAQATDTTTGSPTFVDLLSFIITTTGGNVLVWATFAASLAGLTALPAEIDFQLTVDGTPQPGGVGLSESAANEPEAGSLLARVTGLAAGAHTIAVQWRVTNSQTAQIRPFTQPGRESATVMAMETLV